MKKWGGEKQAHGHPMECYAEMRKAWLGKMMGMSLLALLLIPLGYGMDPSDWSNILYGWNRVYLIIIACVCAETLWSAFQCFFRWDEKMIRKAIQRRGLNENDVISSIKDGRLYIGESAESIFISQEYCIFFARYRYVIEKTNNIVKLGFVDGNIFEKRFPQFSCLMKNNNLYKVALRKETALKATEYLKTIIE